ncbi:hypothetical protein HZB07_05355 [Candidatus Saganbacteria bacterium]|nr:hypothetical protein [Candidatus Saganbacteria bacterium]
MRHKIKLTVNEKIRAWLDLSDFSFRLMKAALSKKELMKRIEKMNLTHAERNRLILARMAKVK